MSRPKAALRIDIRKLKDALRLKFEGGQSHQQIAAALGISKGDEHSAAKPLKPWRYSQFCENYRQFAKRLKRSMRQVHRAGEKFIDFAGLRHTGADGQRLAGTIRPSNRLITLTWRSSRPIIRPLPC